MLAYNRLFFLLGLCLCFGMLALTIGLCKRRRYEKHTADPYECGLPAAMETRGPFSVKYYIVALLFVIFDIELLFLLLWGAVLQELSWTAKIIGIGFLALLGIGLAYELMKKATVWE
jgi:NADH-quinone oxidoreductase subunit A